MTPTDPTPSDDVVERAAKAVHERRMIGPWNDADLARAALSQAPQVAATDAGEEEADAFLVEWERNGETWVHAHADEPTAIDQAKNTRGTCTPLFRVLRTQPDQGGEGQTREGWRLVPVEPTEAMIDAYIATCLFAGPGAEAEEQHQRTNLEAAWSAMLAAAPEPQP